MRALYLACCLALKNQSFPHKIIYVTEASGCGLRIDPPYHDMLKRKIEIFMNLQFS